MIAHLGAIYSQAYGLLIVHRNGGYVAYIIYIYMQVMGEDHEFVTDWLVSQGLHNINIIYLQQCSYCNTKL